MTKKSIPKTMRAAAIDRFGKPDVLSVHSLPVPVPGSGEVLIAVDTAGVAKWDADMREGWSPTGRTHFPFILGTDGAGTVAAVGRGVRRFKVGDAVYGSSFETGGFYAEYVAVDVEKVGRVPKALDLQHAGAIPITGVTALQGIDMLKLKKGETIIIHGATGGVGSLAVQFAEARGARVLATASGRDGSAFVRRLGADAAVDGHHENIATAARRFAPDGIDAVLALAGGQALEQCLDSVRSGGRLAYPNGVEPEPKKRRVVKIMSYDERLNRAIEIAKLKVPIAEAYSLADAAKAHRRLAKGHVFGKIVLRITS